MSPVRADRSATHACKTPRRLATSRCPDTARGPPALGAHMKPLKLAVRSSQGSGIAEGSGRTSSRFASGPKRASANAAKGFGSFAAGAFAIGGFAAAFLF